ncbi:MAG: tRNA uridine-5-carboxymethylaminomethyl(34) synthesis GTPase MnmE [Alphaproteobacteria bacterium]
MTIFAPATAPGRAGIAVIRISGPRASAALEALSGVPPPARRAVRRRLQTPGGTPLDDALVLWFPAPASFTGEDVAELHLHGGPAVVAATLEALAALPGLRPAEPGAFTRRAFDNGKLDLTAVEGLADLVAAETEAQRCQALRQLDGALARLYDHWREKLLKSLACMEAAIDFPEDDLPSNIVNGVNHNIGGIQAEIIQHLDDNRRGERLREGATVTILGAPNVGKSSLLNRLARRDAAIVSHHAGTTRDVIEVRMDLGGYPTLLADTAGLRESADDIEEEGMRRALARAADADLRIAMFDATVWPATDEKTRALIDDDALVVVNKTDLAPLGGDATLSGRRVWPLSCRTGEGVDAFVDALEAAVATRLDVGVAPALTRARHRAALEDCAAALERARTVSAIELGAADLRLAVRALGRITGRVDVEDLLDVIFAEFCIGK